MEADKMKLKVLAAISSDLAKHIETVFDELSKKRDINYCIEDVIRYYLDKQEKPEYVIVSSKGTAEVVESKRDIAFIYYCLSCPFFYELGINEQLDRAKLTALSEAINVKRSYIFKYTLSGKHYYKVYESYRNMVDHIVEYIQKK